MILDLMPNNDDKSKITTGPGVVTAPRVGSAGSTPSRMVSAIGERSRSRKHRT